MERIATRSEMLELARLIERYRSSLAHTENERKIIVQALRIAAEVREPA